jgi:hypothetical protein
VRARAASLSFLALCALARAAQAQTVPDDYGPLPDDYGPVPEASRIAPPVAPIEAPRYRPLLQLSWRHFDIGRAGEAVPGNASMQSVSLEWFPISSYVRLGLATEYAREASDRPQKDWYLGEFFSFGLQRPGLVTPFVDAQVGGAYLRRFVVEQEQPTFLWAFGIDGGLAVHVAGSFYLSASVGWFHPVWLLISTDVLSGGKDLFKQVYADTLAFKVGMGL